MSLLLCCEGFLVLQGLVVIIAGDFHLFRHYIFGRRRWIMGLLIFVCAPLAIFLGDLALGSTPPGPIDGADVPDALARLFAAFVEWAVVLGAFGIVVVLLFTAPREKPVYLPSDDSQPDTVPAPTGHE